MSKNLSNKKLAIILFNLGGPDSIKTVKPFLFNLFYDPAIIRFKNPMRWIIAKIISTFRTKKAQNIYQLIGGKSPLLEETIAQADALKERLREISGAAFEIFICMRHWYPRAAELIKNLNKYEADEIILLPLYPQFSTTTTGSSINEFKKLTAKDYSLSKIPIKTICCYFNDAKFIEAHVALIKQAIASLDLDTKNNHRVLFSAHSLPKKIIEDGDPYQWQIEQTVKNIVDHLDINNLDYKLAYQSKATPVEWLTPDTEEEIRQTCIERKALIVIPLAFVSEHVETLVELDIEYKAIADQYKIKYIRIPTLRVDNIFINSLSEMIINLQTSKDHIISNSKGIRVCPKEFTACPCNL